ncbi:hypothetical protein C8R47DRAFT_1285164 [Mycena vitilis]|nr:hypothetical protein C8R47DRAFT_1285164 [Mycena vitilis]
MQLQAWYVPDEIFAAPNRRQIRKDTDRRSYHTLKNLKVQHDTHVADREVFRGEVPSRLKAAFGRFVCTEDGTKAKLVPPTWTLDTSWFGGDQVKMVLLYGVVKVLWLSCSLLHHNPSMPFIDIPLDVLIEISQELDLLDSLHLIATCTTFAPVLHSRYFWIAALKRLESEAGWLSRPRRPVLSLGTRFLANFAEPSSMKPNPIRGGIFPIFPSGLVFNWNRLYKNSPSFVSIILLRQRSKRQRGFSKIWTPPDSQNYVVDDVVVDEKTITAIAHDAHYLSFLLICRLEIGQLHTVPLASNYNGSTFRCLLVGRDFYIARQLFESNAEVTHLQTSESEPYTQLNTTTKTIPICKPQSRSHTVT